MVNNVEPSLCPAKVIAYSSKLLLSITMLSYVTILMLGSCRQPNREVPEHSKRIDLILDSTDDLLNSGETQKAKTYFDSSYNTIQVPGILDRWRKYEHKVNFYLNYEKNTAIARLYADSMFYAIKNKNLQYKGEYAKAIFANSEVLMAEKRYTEAFNSYYRGQSFAGKYLDSCNLHEFTYKLGLVKYLQGEYLKAIPYFKQAFTESRSCKDSDGFNKVFLSRQSNLNTTALSYERAGKSDSAVKYYQLALSFINTNTLKYPDRKQFMQMARGVVLGNLGGVLAVNNNFPQAEKYLKESIHINDQPLYDVRDAQTARIKLADLYLKSSRFKQASELLDQLEDYLSDQQNNNPANENIRLKYYKLKWNYFDLTGQTFKAYSYSTKYHTFQDSINLVNVGLKEIDLDQVFKDSRQQYKLTLLQRENELKQWYLTGSILIALLAIFLLGMIWYNLKHSRKLNRKMQEQNEQLQMALSSLEQSQRENTDLMKVVAHDLRNPIGGITSLTELMLMEQGRSEEDVTMLKLIHTSGINSLDLVNDLLISNTFIKGPEKEQVDLYLMLHYCVEILSFKAEHKRQEIILKTTHVTVLVNREKMWRVVSNLIANAIKFSPEASEILIQTELLTDTVLIKVEDHGIGIPAEMKDKVFDMFTEAKREGTGGEKPFGLGLAICRQIVEAHGGKIWFNSVPGKGTTFYVELPINLE